jgi:hypothetical protein
LHPLFIADTVFTGLGPILYFCRIFRICSFPVITCVWAHQDSNLGPTGYEPVALPTELWAHSADPLNIFSNEELSRLAGKQKMIPLRGPLKHDAAQNAPDARREISEERGVLKYVEVTRRSKQRRRRDILSGIRTCLSFSAPVSSATYPASP